MIFMYLNILTSEKVGINVTERQLRYAVMKHRFPSIYNHWLINISAGHGGEITVILPLESLRQKNHGFYIGLGGKGAPGWHGWTQWAATKTTKNAEMCMNSLGNHFCLLPHASFHFKDNLHISSYKNEFLFYLHTGQYNMAACTR